MDSTCFGVGTLDHRIGQPTDALIAALQQERRLSLVYPTTASDADRQALQAQRRETDQLATRMRRNAGNLVVLSGAVSGRASHQPVPVVDLVRDALAGVEDYARVTVLPIEPAQLAGRAVGTSSTHSPNSSRTPVSFSLPHTPVQLTGQPVASGLVIEVEETAARA